MASTSSPTPAAAGDTRLHQLQEWLSSLTAPAIAVPSIRPASADASFRRYFRVDAAHDKADNKNGNVSTASTTTYIVMDAPPPQEDVRPFLHVAAVFGATGVSVPHVIAQDIERGFLLLSDLGSTTYLHQLNIDTAHKLYSDAIDALILRRSSLRRGRA